MVASPTPLRIELADSGDPDLGGLVPAWGDPLSEDANGELEAWRERGRSAVLEVVDGDEVPGIVLGRGLARGYRVEQVHVRGDGLDRVLSALVAWRPGEHLEVLVGPAEPKRTDVDDALAAAGFAELAENLEYELELDPAPPPAPRGGHPLTYRTLGEVGRRGMAAMLERIWADGGPTGRPAAAELDDFIEAAGAGRGRPDTSLWRVAYHRTRPAGAFLAYSAGGTGVLQYFGLVPEARGLGLGTLMHADALRLLRLAGARRYEDSTRVDNEPMRHVLAAAGCTLVRRSRLYVRGPSPPPVRPRWTARVPGGAHTSLLRKA